VSMMGAGLRPSGKSLDSPPYPKMQSAPHFYPDRQHRSPVDAVVISSNGKGDQPGESLEVKAPAGWETGQIRAGGRAIWQAVANGRTVEASKLNARVKRICGSVGSAEPLTNR
jgi:hypothetical protein